MTYEELKAFVGEHKLPIDAINENGEFTLIEGGCNGADPYYRVTTAQQNGWLRINYIYKSGMREEMFEK